MLHYVTDDRNSFVRKHHFGVQLAYFWTLYRKIGLAQNIFQHFTEDNGAATMNSIPYVSHVLKTKKIFARWTQIENVVGV